MHGRFSEHGLQLITSRWGSDSNDDGLKREPMVESTPQLNLDVDLHLVSMIELKL